MSLGYSVLAFLAAALFGIIAWRSHLPQAVQLFCGFASLLFGVTGVMLTVDWVGERVAVHATAMREALAITPATEFARALANLEEYQADILRTHVLRLDMITSPDHDPVVMVNCPGASVPLGWIAGYLEECTETYPALIPVRSYGEGSHGRDYSTAFTSLCVMHGWATEAVGNRPAQWTISLGEVAERLGI